MSPSSAGPTSPGPTSPRPTFPHYFSQHFRLHQVDWGNAPGPPLSLVQWGLHQHRK